MRNEKVRVVRTALAAGALAASTVVGVGTAPAQAYPWDPHVLVFGSVGSCGPSAGYGWGWFSADDGESGWMSWAAGSSFSFQLNRVPSGGATLVTIKWGAGNCTAVRYRLVSRPTYSNLAGLGYLG